MNFFEGGRVSGALMRTHLWVLAILTGCAGQGQPDAGAVTLTEYCRWFNSDHTCAFQKACGLAAADVPCDVISNNSRTSSTTCDALLFEQVDAGRVRFDGVGARKCIESAATCGLQACSPVVGQVDVGGECHSSLECVPSAWCSGGCPGTCVPRLAPGTTAPTWAACASETSSPLADGGWLCQSLVGFSQSCGPQAQCDVGLECVGGQCQSLAGVGQPCLMTGCGPGLLCSKGKCVARPARGESCSAGLSCQRGLACRAGVCGSALEVDESCAGNENNCGKDLQCNPSARLCEPRGTAGHVCTSWFDCAMGLACSKTGVCIAQRSIGEACASSDECVLGLACVSGQCQAAVCGP